MEREALVASDKQGSSYECPECGETVSNEDLDGVRLHHAHVLQPLWRDPTAAILQARMHREQLENERHEQAQSAFGETARILTLRR